MSDETERDALVFRVLALEKAVDWLQRDLSELRAQARLGAAPAHPAPSTPRDPVVDALPARPSAFAPVPPQRTGPQLDLETLVGRYGMLALATVLALAAAGTFASWAIKHGLLGPAVRVTLGFVVAAALATWGLWLRRRERSFGDSILGLALAITQVCAWAAGPSLHLVPPYVALVLSAAASVALAAFALLEGDEPLWCVGFGGAAIAPFVTSTGQGTAPMLAAYAAAVLIAGGSALGSRPWTMAARVFAAAAALFTFAVLAMPLQQRSAELALALPFVAGTFGVVPFARGAVLRPRLRTLGLLAAAAAVHLIAVASHSLPVAIAVIAAGVLWLLSLERFDTEPAGTVLDGLGDAGPELADWIDGGLIPAAFAYAACFPLAMTNLAVGAWALAATLLAFVASRREEGPLRDALALVAFLCANATIAIAAQPSDPLTTAAIAANAALFTLLDRAVPNRSWKAGPQIALALAGVATLVLLTLRRSYEYTPFLTKESFAALVVAASSALTVVLSRNRAALVGVWVFAFLWVHQELAWAVSPSAATLLIVTYYAGSSVACVGVGRAREQAKLRHVGLGLGIVAALLALRAAWGFNSTATRIGAYLVVSAFLLGIAWWYRRPGAQPGPDAA
jgi:hypothetical protein